MLTLKFPESRVARPSKAVSSSSPYRGLRVPNRAAWLLVEAIELAEGFGCRVVEAELDNDEGGVCWGREGRTLWVDLNDSPERRLAAIADALRGEPGLVFARMSRELADYLAPRRAA